MISVVGCTTPRESLLWCWCLGEKPAGASNGGFEVEVIHNSQSSETKLIRKLNIQEFAEYDSIDLKGLINKMT